MIKNNYLLVQKGSTSSLYSNNFSSKNSLGLRTYIATIYTPPPPQNSCLVSRSEGGILSAPICTKIWGRVKHTISDRLVLSKSSNSPVPRHKMAGSDLEILPMSQNLIFFTIFRVKYQIEVRGHDGLSC